MSRRYRVVFQKKTLIEALFAGRSYTDWYVAQCRRLIFWSKIGIYPSREAAEAACEQHAGGTLIAENARIVSEFERKD
ncbi:MAG TPA: hypothetical protein VF649_10875 [Sphingomonas sp.]|jgi:hypothetical protein|uniref:hypothetical protein n=1 Tax=Sphingomonas sp. TaxID=28214 RepID=UPI002EDAABE0